MTVEFMNCFMRTFPVLKAIDETESPRNETSPGDHRREIVQAAFIRPRHNNCPLDCRAQFIACSSDVVITFSSNRPSIQGVVIAHPIRLVFN